MPAQPLRPHDLQWRIFRGSEAVRGGLLTVNQLRGAAWMRLRSDVYADARLDRDHELACRAASLRLPSTAAIAGPSAACLWGVRHARRPRDEVHVVVPAGERFGPRRGLRVHKVELRPGDVERQCGMARTSPLRTAWDVAAWLDPATAVSVVDGLLVAGRVTVEQLRAETVRRRGDRYWRRAVAAFRLVDPAVRSPAESHLRVRLLLAQLPRPVSRHPVRLGDGTALDPGLAWPAAKVGVIAGGVPDRRLAAAGWVVLAFSAERLRADMPGVLRAVRLALRARGYPGL
jgi:hypothetical protein